MFYKRDSFIAIIAKTTDFMAVTHGKKNCSNVCFLFLLVLFREILKTQLPKLRISPSPVQVIMLSLKTTTSEFVVFKLCAFGHPAMELG